MITSRLPESLAQPLRFGVVGILNTGLGVGAFWVLGVLTGMPILIANTLPYCLGVLNSFFLNRLWTFRVVAYRSTAVVQLPLFLLVSAVGLGIANLSLWLAALALPIVAAKLVSVAVTFLWNFWASKQFVFRPGSSAPS